MRALELAVHGTVAVTVATLCASLFDSTLFSYHPTFMSIGFLAAMSEGVLTALKFRQLEGQQRVAAIQRHLYIQLAAALAITAGFYAIYRNKVQATCHV
jgi:cytochrome b-561 domain containing protein 2